MRRPRGIKLFVLDTNVLMHDPQCIYRFAEHDVFIPMMTLDELDNHKTGMSEVARNTRQATRLLDHVVAQHENGMDAGIDLAEVSSGMASGRLYFQASEMGGALPAMLPAGKGDNQILGVVLALKGRHPKRQVVLVSKDINIRIKARALGLNAENYKNDQSVDDSDLLPTGIDTFGADFWEAHGKNLSVCAEGREELYAFTGPAIKNLELSRFIHLPDSEMTLRVIRKAGRKVTARRVMIPKGGVCGIEPKNVEQACALDLLLDPEIDFVTLLGQAGTGKTLLTLAAAVHQVHVENRYAEILVTRATVAIGKEIGFLPGDEVDKMAPWMGAIEDNLEVIQRGTPSLAKPNTAGQVQSKIKMKSISFMRGRTFLRKFVIIDEAQNLTPKEMTALITRAGPGTKIICLGNLKQIDTPYLTEGGSGLAYVAERFRGWNHAGSLILKDCVRSRLADYASGVL